jgi:hypothetical protein
LGIDGIIRGIKLDQPDASDEGTHKVIDFGGESAGLFCFFRHTFIKHQ